MDLEEPTGSGESPPNESEAKLRECTARYLYLRAEFDNFRKRTARDQEERVRMSWKPIAYDLLDVIDNLERALEHSKEAADSDLRSGIELTLKKLHGVLERNGVQRLDADGAEFDPEFHEAVAHAPSDQERGKIIQTDAPGYTIHGKLLRPAQVVVSAGNQKENAA